MQICNTHLLSAPEHWAGLITTPYKAAARREAQLLELLTWLRLHEREGVPQILAGDFNFTEGEKSYFTARERFYDLHRLRFPYLKHSNDSYNEQAESVTFDPTTNRWLLECKEESQRIDYIFGRNISKSCAIYSRRFAEGNRAISDHFGVCIEFFMEN